MSLLEEVRKAIKEKKPVKNTVKKFIKRTK